MYKKSLTPEESLNTIKVRMKYDLSKTLQENKSSIYEQSSACPNAITYDELKDIAISSGNIAKKMDASFVRMGYGEERAKDLYNTVKSLVGKNVYDEIDNECSNALEKFKQKFKQTGSQGWFQGGFDLESKINEFIKGYYSDDEEVKRYLKATLKLLMGQSTKPVEEPKPERETSQRQQNINNAWCSVKNGIITAPGGQNNSKWDSYSTTFKVTPEELEIAKKSCPKGSNSGGKKRTSIQIPSELKTVEGIKHFQDWLDTNHPGWASGYTDGVLLKGKNGGGYGSFGPRTSKAWASYKTDYLSGKTKTTSKVEVDSDEVDANNEPVNLVEK